MRVLHIIPSVAALRGGPSQAIVDIVAAQRQQGLQAEIATTNDNGPEVLDVPLNQVVNYPLGQSLEHQVPIRFFARQSVSVSAVREFSFSWPLTRWLWQALPTYDLLHVHALFSYPSTVAMGMARSRQIPYVIRPIGQLCHWSLAQSRAKKQAYLRLIEKANLRGARALHFTSQQEQTEAQGLQLPTPGFVVPHGLHLPVRETQAKTALRKRLNIPGDEPIVLFLSRLHPKKGLDRLILALAKLTGQRFHLVIAGSGDTSYEAEIDRLLAQTGLTHRTHRVGFSDGSFKQQLLQGADLFALPSHSENFGIAVLEALAAGLPVLTSPGVALSTVVEQHQLGWVVENTPELLAQTLGTVLQQPEVLLAMGQRGREVVRSHFSWPILTRQLIHHYQHCLSNVSPTYISEFVQ